jgi:phospholipid/cholesterol/gamma-HCH transport system permease protein
MAERIKNLGERFLNFLYYAGGVFILFAQTVFWLFIPPWRRRQTFDQMNKVGIESAFIVFLTALFTGMVLAFQTAYQMQKISAEKYIASIIALSITRELGPVLTALVVAGRIGAAITAELGTMQVTEQIDALQTMATNPVRYLVVPRFFALIMMLPILTIYADAVGIIGGWLIGFFKLGIGSQLYFRMTFDPLRYKDILTGLFKSLIFGMIICIVSCYQGFKTEGGAEGVGRATTVAVVISFIMIIAADCLFTALFYFIRY